MKWYRFRNNSDACSMSSHFLNARWRRLSIPIQSYSSKGQDIELGIFSSSCPSLHRSSEFQKQWPPDKLKFNLTTLLTLQWLHNGRDSVSNHQTHDCLLRRLFKYRSKKTSKLRVTGLCAGNSPGTGEFPAQMVSNAENVSIWWRHHELNTWWLDKMAAI